MNEREKRLGSHRLTANGAKDEDTFPPSSPVSFCALFPSLLGFWPVSTHTLLTNTLETVSRNSKEGNPRGFAYPELAKKSTMQEEEKISANNGR